jgi:hypothetical protein
MVSKTVKLTTEGTRDHRGRSMLRNSLCSSVASVVKALGFHYKVAFIPPIKTIELPVLREGL